MPLDKGKNGFTLPKLPYAEEALAPVISAKTISFHYGKHHKAYVETLNELIEGTAYAQMSLEDIVKKSAKDEKAKKIFNNAGQAWPDFYWQSTTAKAARPPARSRRRRKTLRRPDALQEGLRPPRRRRLAAAGLLIHKEIKLAIETTSNADTPIAHGRTPLLAPTWGSTPTTSTIRTAGPITFIWPTS
jgi:Fe-Mn family superoxide dismutase